MSQGTAAAAVEGGLQVEVARGEFSDEDAPPDSSLARWAAAALLACARDAAPGALEIGLVDDREMARLNAAHRGKTGPTNVLSFPPGADGWPLHPQPGVLALCPPVLRDEARNLQAPLREHWAHMVVHGVLHLCGLHHENPAQERAMRLREGDIMRSLGFPDPWGRA